MPHSFPSLVEIIGALAAVVPFAIQTASSSWRTENGRVVQFVYRDWVAVGAGGMAALAGLVALLLVARTDKPKRIMRVLAGLALIAAGTFSLLRGFGIVGVSRPESSETSTVQIEPQPRPQPDAGAPVKGPAIDGKAASQQFFVMWKADTIAQLAQDMQLPQKGRSALVRFFELSAPHLGPVVAVKRATVEGPNNGALPRIVGDVEFANGTTQFSLEVSNHADGTPYVSGIDMMLPDEMQKRLEAAATPESAAKFAREALAIILTGKLADAVPMFDLQLIDNIPDDFEPQLRDVLAKIGPKSAITVTKQDDCAAKKKEMKTMQCFEYALVTARGKSLATVDLGFVVGRWYVFAFNLTPPER